MLVIFVFLLPRWHVVKNLPANAEDGRDMGSIPGWGRYPRGGNGHPLQYFCLRDKNSRD